MNPVLKTLYAELTDIIDKANATIKGRNTRKSNGDKGNGGEITAATETAIKNEKYLLNLMGTCIALSALVGRIFVLG
jgi:hypothetical protein